VRHLSEPYSVQDEQVGQHLLASTNVPENNPQSGPSQLVIQTHAPLKSTVFGLHPKQSEEVGPIQSRHLGSQSPT